MNDLFKNIPIMSEDGYYIRNITQLIVVELLNEAGNPSVKRSIMNKYAFTDSQYDKYIDITIKYIAQFLQNLEESSYTLSSDI